VAIKVQRTCLLGCTLPYTPPSLTGNWQIQYGTAITSPPTAPYLVGAIEESGSTLTGKFSTAQISTIGPTVESYSGTYNSSTGSLILNSTLPLPAEQITATLSVPANPTDLSTGTLVFQCGVCSSAALYPVVAVQIAPLNDTYTGNYSRIGIARVRFSEFGDPVGVERLGIALEPEAEYERRPDGGGGCEDPRVTFVEPLQRYIMTYTAYSS
jgi:hypothetical protein